MNDRRWWRLFMKLMPNDLVEVKSPDEIVATLGPDGTLDGMPFMPEMLPFCGKQFKVLRRAEKTCLEVASSAYVIREFINNDVYFLEGLRCTGADHDGCQRACLLFWKAAWLKAVQETRDQASSDFGERSLNHKFPTKTTDRRYFCQSTQLLASTINRPLRKTEILKKLARELSLGTVRLGELFELVLAPAFRKVRDRLFGRPRLRGTLQRTPVGDLNLQPGELVEIRSLDEMRETLDTRGRNRGLVCDIEFKKFCGKRYRVLSRMDRMICESSGEMREVKGTVFLDGHTCLCARVFGGCPRQEYCYWREVWLRRVSPSTPT
jgi:hypothetical protein